MKRSELNPLLQKEYSSGLECGVEHVAGEGLENLWFVVPPAPPRKLPPRLPAAAISQANQVIESLPRLSRADPLEKLVSFLFMRKEAVESSRMEGTWSTIDHVLTPGEIYDAQAGRSERGSVLGYAHALETEIETVAREGARAFCPALVSRLHARMMREDSRYQGKPGTLRAPGAPGEVVFIGGLSRREDSVYNPTPARHVARCLEETLQWMRDEELIELGNAGMGIPLPVRMAIGHSHFEAVHPFPDGNGRVGRMLLTLQQSLHGVLPLYLSGFVEAERDEYSRALQAAQKQLEYGPIVDFLCSAIVASHRDGGEARTRIRELPELWARRGRFRAGSAAARFAAAELIHRPIFTTGDIARSLGVSAPAANQAAARLLEARVVRQRSEGKWGRVFAAEEVIELLSRRFGDDSRLALARAHQLLGLEG